jgi:hypothetical protein
MKLKDVDYVRLPEVYDSFYGVGIPGLSAKLIDRTETEAIYYRWDGVYEVFRIKVALPSEYFGSNYPKREVYPGNEAFGSTAWCFKDEKLALKRYEAIVKHSISIHESDTNDSNDS